MSEIKPKKEIHYIGEEFIRRYLHISPEDMYNSPRMRLSIDWETEQLQQEISAKKGLNNNSTGKKMMDSLRQGNLADALSLWNQNK